MEIHYKISRVICLWSWGKLKNCYNMKKEISAAKIVNIIFTIRFRDFTVME